MSRTVLSQQLLTVIQVPQREPTVLRAVKARKVYQKLLLRLVGAVPNDGIHLPLNLIVLDGHRRCLGPKTVIPVRPQQGHVKDIVQTLQLRARQIQPVGHLADALHDMKRYHIPISKLARGYCQPKVAC